MILHEAAAKLEALGNPVRLSIFRMLVRAGTQGLHVGTLQERLDIPASTLSHHLKTLTGRGLVRQTREGTRLICTAEYEAMQAIVAFLVSECCVEEVGIL